MVALTLVQLSSIVEGDFSKIETLDLSQRELEDIENLSCFRSLKKVQLKNNKLSDLQFLHLNLELRWIGAENNWFSGPLHSNAFRDLTQLTVLNLSHNKITRIDDALTALPNLKTLILSHNSLTTLNGLGNLGKLETLILSNNRLESFSMPKKPLPNFKKLSLAHNNIKEFFLNENVFNLRELRLNSNKLTKLPERIFYCSYLSVLDVGKNCLMQPVSDCCDTLRRCKQLSNLNLAGNDKLATTPAEWDSIRSVLKNAIATLVVFNSIHFGVRKTPTRKAKRDYATSTIPLPSQTFSDVDQPETNCALKKRHKVHEAKDKEAKFATCQIAKTNDTEVPQMSSSVPEAIKNKFTVCLNNAEKSVVATLATQASIDTRLHKQANSSQWD